MTTNPPMDIKRKNMGGYFLFCIRNTIAARVLIGFLLSSEVRIN